MKTKKLDKRLAELEKKFKATDDLFEKLALARIAGSIVMSEQIKVRVK